MLVKPHILREMGCRFEGIVNLKVRGEGVVTVNSVAAVIVISYGYSSGNRISRL